MPSRNVGMTLQDWLWLWPFVLVLLVSALLSESANKKESL